MNVSVNENVSANFLKIGAMKALRLRRAVNEFIPHVSTPDFTEDLHQKSAHNFVQHFHMS